jgi:glyoxylase-like metal-dependent hydrolase (beta-lactamase superfamily II)
VAPIEEAGLLELVDAPEELATGVSLRPTPGHTPGHQSVVLDSGGSLGVITGDMVHSPIQLVEPSWTYKYDTDAVQAKGSVESVVDLAAQRSALILGTHFPSPTAGHLRREAGNLRWLPR